MTKMNKFSSWNPAAVYEAYKVLGDTAFVLGLKPSLEEEYARWKSTNRLKNGLYWQGDVQDGMEESISGGRRKQYARPADFGGGTDTYHSHQYCSNICSDKAPLRHHS